MKTQTTKRGNSKFKNLIMVSVIAGSIMGNLLIADMIKASKADEKNATITKEITCSNGEAGYAVITVNTKIGKVATYISCEDTGINKGADEFIKIK